jgi:very-short-patch-repair endonuclease
MTEIFNKKEMKERRQSLRNQATLTEARLWERLRKKQILGVRFRRQFSIGNYIVDFYSPKIKLAIEIDGKSHDTETKREYDSKREKEIRELGINVLRFRNHEVLDEIDNVIKKIEDAIKTFPLVKGKTQKGSITMNNKEKLNAN